MLLYLFSYLLFLLLLGWYLRRRGGTKEGFFIAGRKLGFLAVSSTLSATVIGGSATLVAASYVYKRGIAGISLDLAGGIGLVLLGLTLARRVRRFSLFTLPEIMGEIYGNRVRWFSSLIILLAEIGWCTLLIQAGEAVFSSFMPIKGVFLLALITLVFVVYTTSGGQWAVAYTDVVQLLIMVSGIFATAFLALRITGFMNIWSRLAMTSSSVSGGSLSEAISIILLAGLSHLVGSDIYAKLLSAKDEKTAGRAALASGIFKIVFGLAIGVIAISGFALLPELAEPGDVLPRMMLSLLPHQLAWIGLLSLLAVIMSSADSVLLTAATVFTNDLLPNRLISGLEVRVSRIMVPVVGGFSFLLAVYLKDLLATFRLSYTVFVAGLTLPLLVGFLTKRRLDQRLVLAAMMVGGGVGVVLELKKISPAPLLYALGSGGAILLFAFIKGLLLPGERGREKG
jgi:SSS family solute:Na+ symporter